MPVYLKALEIHGFKSFPEKTRLTFEKPVTAIVGPNGSGKSNISDAIRWVMGEQSTKALRGGKMEDVIFGGTVKRGPLGFAEVSLILDNSGHTFDIESEEVMITRRYYRSGESEYYLNKQTVRLKDVNELLMDTGLGREGYSIIGQGRIDEILSIRSTDRREIFEEAAGISRFRHRKEESERKLAKAEENLLRVSDKIAELELQVEPLRSQAETAKKYLILRDEMRGLEISVWTDNLQRLAKQSDKLGADFKYAKAQLDEMNKELEELYEKGETFSRRMFEKDAETEKVRERLSNAESETADAEANAAVLRTKLEHNAEDIQRIKAELLQQESRDSNIEAQIAQQTGRIDELSNLSKQTEEKIDSLNFELEELIKSAGNVADELAALIKKEADNAIQIAEEKAKLSTAAASLQELEDRSSAVLTDIADAETRLANAENEDNENKKELKKAREEAQSIKNMIGGHTMRVESRRRKADAAADKKVRLTMDMNAISSRIAMLSEMEKDFEGYSKAVKAVMQESSRGILKNIHGTVANLVKASDKYALAIETALGGSMQNIIVESDTDGKAAINFLKRRDSGRATFLPISVIKGTRLNERGLEDEDGFEGVAIDLISFDKKYIGIYTNLLGRTAVVDDMDNAVRIARKYGNRFRIVTVDGQIINAGGSMTGGSTSKNVGILSRANELKRLSEQAEIMKTQLSEAQKDADEAQRELKAAEYGLNTAQDELRLVENNALKLEENGKRYELIIESIRAGRDQLKAESSGIAGKLEQSANDIKSARSNIALLEKAAAEIKSIIEEKSVGQEKLTQNRQVILDSLSELKADIASNEAESQALRRTISELDELRRDFSEGSRQKEELIGELSLKGQEIKREISEKEKEIDRLKQSSEKLKTRISDIGREKMDIEAERTRHERDTQEKNRLVLDMERESSRLEQKKLAAELEEKQIVDKLWDTYELSRSMAMEQREEIDDLQAATKRINELKREISKLGTPNIGAIDEFERVNTRYTYLTDQREDIEKAKADLTDIIGDITDEMKEIFVREFHNIDDSFKKTFADLFGGGKAALELEDPEDVLNCGIEIKVQPPGKSLKTITLLSGGEKAFVAIALYFAIIKIRPAPFVVMDEIEAALDDANVSRFAEYIRTLTSKTQFLLISHRRGTMEEADVLYGVTMQEQGVSRVLNIDLDEAEKTITK